MIYRLAWLLFFGVASARILPLFPKTAKVKQIFFDDTKKAHEDARLTTPELVEKYGYPSETHITTSQDGYILTMHRIPYGRNGYSDNRSVVFLQHGILASSGDWVITGTEKGLGYILADMGYDVWMGNVRGNRYSRNHTYLDPDSGEFWDFSWHQMGVYDLPAMIDYVAAQTDQERMYYVGHSQGSTIFYVMCSERPEYNEKITAQFSLAPIAFTKNMKSPLLQTLSLTHWGLEQLLPMIGVNEFLPQSSFMATIGNSVCKDGDLTQVICTNTLFAICGFNKAQMNTTLLPVILGHTPAGASTKQFLHFAQEIRSGRFRRWDYGLLGNLKRYQSLSPPDYKLRNVKVPVYLFHGANDWLSSSKDVMTLYKELGNPQAYVLVPDLKFNHLDFIFGIDAPNLVYDTMTALMTIDR